MNQRADTAACRLGVGAVVLLAAVLGAAAAWAFQGEATGNGSDTTLRNAVIRTDCSANLSEGSGSLACLSGRTGGQTLKGGRGSGENLLIQSTNDATKGKVIFGAAGTTAYDEVNDRFGIGTASPTRGLEIDRSTTGQTLLNGTNGEIISLAYGTNTSADALWLGQARGTIASPTAIQSGDQMGGLNFVGHDGAAFVVGARILGQAAETWVSGSTTRGSEIRFHTTPTGGGATMTLRARLTALGDWIVASAGVGISRDLQVTNTDNTNTSSNARFLAQVGGTSAGDPYIRFNTPSGTVADWSVGADNSDTQKFKVSRASTLGTNDALTIDSTNNVTITTLNNTRVAVLIGEAAAFAHANLGGAM